MVSHRVSWLDRMDSVDETWEEVEVRKASRDSVLVEHVHGNEIRDRRDKFESDTNGTGLKNGFILC